MGILNVDNLRGVGSGTSVTCLSNRLETTNINASGIITATGFVGPFENTGDFTIDDWIVHAGDTNTKFGFSDADTFTIETAGSQRINIRNDGKIQVGTSGGNSTYLTTSTNAALDVWGDGSAYPTLRLGTENYQIVGEDIRFGRIDHGATDIRYHSLVSRHDTTGANNYLQFRIHDAGSSPYQSQKIALHINGLGQVGVGTYAPSGSLGVWDPTGSDPTMSLHHSNADVEGEIIRVGRTDIPTIRYHSIKAKHGGAEVANYIKFDLHNGSGTINQSEVLRLEGGGIIKCGTNGVLKAEINNAVSGHQFISQCDNNNNGFEIYQQHGSTATRNTLAVYDNRGNSNAKQLSFAVVGDGNVSVPNGNLVMGNDYGISFLEADDTATGETVVGSVLNDYEYGTFTPAYGFDSAPTISYHTQKGGYVKVGPKVYFQVYIRLNSCSGGSGNLWITGLPYTAGNATSTDHSAYGGLTIAYTNQWAGNAVDRGLVGSNGTICYLYCGTSGGTNVNASPSNLNTTQLRAFGSYLVPF